MKLYRCILTWELRPSTINYKLHTVVFDRSWTYELLFLIGHGRMNCCLVIRLQFKGPITLEMMQIKLKLVNDIGGIYLSLYHIDRQVHDK